jgi:hypothetical protein
MLRNNKLSVVIMLASLNAIAGVQKSAEPLSGLNMEDFEASAGKSPKWESNPFVKYGDAPATKQMILYGIVWNESKALALINSDVVKVGDKVGTSQVVAIEKAKVILRNSDGLYQITFKGTQNDKT